MPTRHLRQSARKVGVLRPSLALKLNRYYLVLDWLVLAVSAATCFGFAGSLDQTIITSCESVQVIRPEFS